MVWRLAEMLYVHINYGKIWVKTKNQKREKEREKRNGLRGRCIRGRVERNWKFGTLLRFFNVVNQPSSLSPYWRRLKVTTDLSCYFIRSYHLFDLISFSTFQYVCIPPIRWNAWLKLNTFYCSCFWCEFDLLIQIFDLYCYRLVDIWRSTQVLVFIAFLPFSFYENIVIWKGRKLIKATRTRILPLLAYINYIIFVIF